MTVDDDNIGRVISNLRYQHGEDWAPLPHWCKFYIQLGIEIARYPRVETRFKVALALPTLDFATTFVALGAVIRSAHRASSATDYCEFISSQPLGTSVVYHRANNISLRGTIEGFIYRNDIKYVMIRTSKTDVRQLPLMNNASRITVAETEFKLPQSQQGRRGQPIPHILFACVDNPAGFISKTDLSCLIIAQISDFRREATGLMIGVPNYEGIAYGIAQDILRVRQFLGANQPYRCQVFATSECTEKNLATEINNPPFVIFAGSNGYLRQHSKWNHSHQIILLDRTERTFQDAVDNLNENYGRRLDTFSGRLQFDPPSGVDVMVLEERIQ